MSIVTVNTTGGAGTKEWLASMAGWSLIVDEPAFAQDMPRRGMLYSGPLTDSDVEIGKRIAQKYGLTE